MSISKFWKEAVAYRLGGGHAKDHAAMNTPSLSLDGNNGSIGLLIGSSLLRLKPYGVSGWQKIFSNTAPAAATAYSFIKQLPSLPKYQAVQLGFVNVGTIPFTVSQAITTSIEAFNARLTKLSGCYINDDYGILAAGSADPVKNNLAYSVSTTDMHLSDAGYAAISVTLKKYIQNACPI